MKVPMKTATLTYTLGQSLYVPLTSRCNTRTLPETRGPGFFLPLNVVSTLCRVRPLEEPNMNHDKIITEESVLTGKDARIKMPPPLPITNQLLKTISLDGTEDDLTDDQRLPSVQLIMEDIARRCSHTSQQELKHPIFWNSIVIAGEGEPTLRWKSLLSLTTLVSTNHRENYKSLRLTTNGLIAEKDAAKQLKDAGVDSVSVALMTSDPDEYQDLMTPMEYGAHQKVCNFVQSAISAGLDVEVTGVESNLVDKTKVENLAKHLGVSNPF